MRFFPVFLFLLFSSLLIIAQEKTTSDLDQTDELMSDEPAFNSENSTSSDINTQGLLKNLRSEEESIELIPQKSDIILFNKDQIYIERIKSAFIRAKGSEHAEAIVSIFPSSKLELTFDDLNDDYREYHFKLEHCDKNWLPTKETPLDFFQSSLSRTIEDYEFSNATKIDYTHYTLEFPRDGEKFLRSGNYLIHIYETDSDSMVLTKRFMVVNPKVSVNAMVVKTDDVKLSNYQQQIKFEVIDQQDVLQDIGQVYVKISKNASWEIYKDNMKPSFVNNERITYSSIDACTFEGGNEYRQFNMIDYKNISNNIVRMQIQNDGSYNLWLDGDKPRSYLKYTIQADYNGKARYTGDNKTYKTNELDYRRVHFSFIPDDMMFGHEIYLYGGLSDFEIKEDFKMIYNPSSGRYEINKLLKQGLYDYQYVVKSIYEKGLDESLLEGSHYETENDYTIFVYYTNVFEGFDELLSIERINSNKPKQ